MDTTISVPRALTSVRARLSAAAQAAGRNPNDVQLVAVSKTHGADAVAQALAAGQFLFGENRLQEAAGKFPALLAVQPTMRLHLIGGLQTNKAKDAVRLCHVIETLDRPKLADAIYNAVQAAGRCPDLLVQVNIGDEPQKSGVAVAQADGFIRDMVGRFGASLTGLMCIPPANEAPARYFKLLASMADAHGLAVRSMGMSGDFETAIACGATHVRVGSAIFGARG
ncbi:MAG: YggS family pyridoxal phosphate enzyme [Acidocella sp. 20-57-95]|nr:MAG: YggS family pyridoxal phosphate enzyme [Acidocella sp. 20-57-95]OYV62265.1 MAG: YggS family pyridoxal phosphate enzyme [Acidocella sp. 21-58-7]HQT63080.1 YggS family pyridoxal phosphate-dependent enzyme [Acidocella sp.]HQU03607.1 YggS family pyridoxal phosphate-dependent enzyme [Acidocella sp.]